MLGKEMHPFHAHKIYNSLEDERIHYYYIAKGEKVPINYDYSSFSKS